MAYVFLPPRTTNYFPPGPPYLAGFGGLRGLGDYASDYATYKHAMARYEGDYKKWSAERKKYDIAKANWDTTVSGMNASYGSAVNAYDRDKAAWDAEYAAYLLAVDAWNNAFSNSKRSNTARALTIAQSYGLSLPQSFFDGGACLTQEQHDAYASQCHQVKGLGSHGLGSSDPNCGMKQLPVCQFGPQPTIRAMPQPPTKPKFPRQPTLRAVPVAPIAPTPSAQSSGGGGGSSNTPSPVPPVPPSSSSVPDSALTPAPHKQANVLMGGLLVAALLGGGYLVYRTVRKPKAQAA